MKRIHLIVLSAALMSTAAWADDITGYVSDENCGAKHSSVSEANSKCLAGCMKKGASPVLVKDGKVMSFDADSKEKAKAFAGQDVKIDGSLDGTVIKINSIEKAS